MLKPLRNLFFFFFKSLLISPLGCQCSAAGKGYPVFETKIAPERNATNLHDIVNHDLHIHLNNIYFNHKIDDVGDRPTSSSIALFRKRFGDDFFSFLYRGVQFIAINSQLYKDSSEAIEEGAAQDDWLRSLTTRLKRLRERRALKSGGNSVYQTEQSQQDPPRHVVAFSHIAPFINTPDEPSEYFNLEKKVRADLLNRLSEAGCTAWFCGHYHRSSTGVYHHYSKNSETRHASKLEVVVSSAIGTTLTTSTKESDNPLGLSGMATADLSASTSGLRVVHVKENEITHKWMSLEEAEHAMSNLV